MNKIVKIIHECTKKWDGKATKNYGDKYLLTWRIPIYAEAIDYIKNDSQTDAQKAGLSKKATSSKLEKSALLNNKSESRLASSSHLVTDTGKNQTQQDVVDLGSHF